MNNIDPNVPVTRVTAKRLQRTVKAVLDAAENGKTQIIIRHSRETAVIMNVHHFYALLRKATIHEEGAASLRETDQS